ncbi:MAG: uroporphyrinogen decarboxylase family protein [Spirochaetia bacterium]|jgi:uroporphyrinogen decarboxylase
MSRKETLSSRERLRRALDHQVPDRVPIDLGGFQTGIHRKAYEALLQHLGMSEEICILDPVQQLARPSEAILQRFHVDTRYIGAHGPDGFAGGIITTIRGGRTWHDLRDEFGVVWSMPEDQMLFMDISHHPLADATVQDLASYPFPKGNDPSRFAGLRTEALRMREASSAALCTAIGGVVYETCWYMRGLERWFMDMLENPGFCEALLDCILTYWRDFYDGFLGEIGDLVDVVMIGDDLAGQNGPLFSPDFYRRIVKPRQKALVQHIKSKTNAKIWYHTCGSCVEYIPDLIDNGVDVLNPVQISARDMEPRSLKQRFGARMALWGGGIDSQRVLPFASPGEVRDEVRRNLEIFMAGGGYVFNNVHNIQHGVPPQNIVALYDAAYEYGFYDQSM